MTVGRTSEETCGLPPTRYCFGRRRFDSGHSHQCTARACHKAEYAVSGESADKSGRKRSRAIVPELCDEGKQTVTKRWQPGKTGIMRTWCMAAQRHGLACRERGFNSRCSHQGNHIYLFSQPRKRFKTGWQQGKTGMPADEKAVLRAVCVDSVTSGFNSPRWAGVTEGIPGTPDGKVGRCAPGGAAQLAAGKDRHHLPDKGGR